MGFGWLFVGYFFVSVVSLYSPLSFAMLAGYPMMILGLYYLAPYQRYYRTSFFFSFLSLPFALYYALYGFGQLGLAVPAFVGTSFFVVEWVYFAFSLLFTALLLWSTLCLCREVGHTGLMGRAMRSMVFFAVTTFMEILARLPVPYIQQNMVYFSLPAVILRLLLIFLNMYLIYGCYRYICPQGEEFSHFRADKEIKKLKETARGGKKDVS